MITIEKVGNRIQLRSSRPTPGLSKTVPGANFNKAQGKATGPFWSLPLSLTGCRSLRERFGDELEIGPALWAWARDEKARASAMRELAGARDAELVLLPKKAPALAKAMEARTYQRVGALFVSQARNCLVADQPGLGKTLEALGGVTEADCPGPYLVVTPKTAVQSVWAREIPRWLGDRHRVVTVPDGAAKRNQILSAWARAGLDERTWVVVHPEMVRTRVWWVCGVCPKETPRKAGKVELKCGHPADLRKANRVDHTFPQLFGIEWGAVICDESDRSLLRLSGTPTQTRQGMEMLQTRESGLRVAMSGTPTRGRPQLLWGTLNWIDPEAFPAFWSWCEAHWDVTDGKYGGKTIGKLVREEELWRSLDPYVLRRTKEEVAPDLPPKSYAGTPAFGAEGPVAVWLEMEAAQSRMYLEMLDSSVATLEDGSEISAVGILAELMRLKQFANSCGKIEVKQSKLSAASEAAVWKRAARKGESLTAEQVDALLAEKYLFKPALPSNKFEYLVQLLSELGYPDDPQTKVVIASQFTGILNLFAAELPARLQALSEHPRTPLRPIMTPVLLTGEVTGRRREDAIDSMNLPVGQGAHLMFLNTKAGGVAITLDEVDVMVVLDETWIPDDQEQLEDRIHRVSRPRAVTYYYLKSLDTVDLGIALTNESREYDTKRLLDGRRGIQYGRAVLDKTKELS